MSDRRPRIWVLLGHRLGDNNQLLALAEALGEPFETRTLHFNLARVVGPRLLGASLASLKSWQRAELGPPWPDMVIGIGWRSVPVARWIRKQSGGRAKLVRIGNPRIDPSLVDLVVTTAQYPVPPEGNVLTLPVAMSRYRDPPTPTDEEAARLDQWPRPHLLMAIGGPTKPWTIDTAAVLDAVSRLRQRSADAGGTLSIVGSPRTPDDLSAAIRDAISGQTHVRFLDGETIRFATLIHDADELFVTGDSVSMISEAVLSGKPVGLIDAMIDLGTGLPGNARPKAGTRDLRAFWKRLFDDDLVGTIDHPARGSIPDPAQIAAARVRALLSDVVE